jgi:predicted Zn-dependent peptidase
MKAGLLMGLDSPSSRAERLARNLAVWGRVPGLDEISQQIDAVSTADVRAYAEKMIVQDRAALALYGPAQAAPDLEGLRRRLAA